MQQLDLQNKLQIWRLACAALSSAAIGCSDNTILPTPVPALDPLRIAVLMPTPEGSANGSPNLEWALENVNSAGGVAGRQLAFDYFEALGMPEEVTTIAAQLAADSEHIAVIGPPGSTALFAAAHLFIETNKPIISTTSTSDDLLRAYGGKGPIWRTRESDIAQTELLVRFAKGANAQRITLLTSLDVGGYTFFSWFGFFTREIGFDDANVNIMTLPSNQPCQDTVKKALETKPEMLFVAPNSPMELECIVKSLPPPGMPRPRIVLADTGLDNNALIGMGAQDVEGFSGAGSDAYQAAFMARFPDQLVAPHGPSEYDAVLLLAYGLEKSKGVGQKPLIAAMKEVVDGTEENTLGFDVDGIRGTLEALRAGKKPMLQGASGPLVFEPNLYMDLASATYAHYQVGPDEITYDQRFSTGDPSFLTSAGAFVKPALPTNDVDQSSWMPAMNKTDTWAVIGALSSGFSNYRHQADALQQYQLLRANGVADDHIVLILADDIVADSNNSLTGQVRNEPSGEDVYAGVKIDYGISVTPTDIQNILQGLVTATTPKVISPTASSNVYIYLAGHGGTAGIPLDAQTTEAGLAGEGAVFSPTNLRETLCTMSANGRFRRTLVVIESCFSGAFGDAQYDGLEFGCGMNAGEFPLEGVVLITAANGREVSYAGAYDREVPEWVNDAFSRQFVTQSKVSLDRSLADVYADAYRGTAGSHPSIFNVEHAGRLTVVSVGEFLRP